MEAISITICLLFILFILTIMIIGTVRRNTAKLELIAYGVRSFNGQLIGGIISVILMLFLLFILIDRARDLFYYLGDTRILSIWDLFNEELMVKVAEEAYEQEDLSTFIRIAAFHSFTFNILISIFGSFCTGTLGLFIGLQKPIIYRHGLIANSIGSLKWDRVDGYQWGNTVQKFTLDGFQEYQELILLIKTSWIGKLFHPENTYENVLRIKLSDKDSVDHFLEEEVCIRPTPGGKK